ncbi:MAG: cysteine desulfurase [Gemmatimonadetes bacterium]|nr:cysteine desulfurase [Gemmatimonadota bacterium]
MKLPVYLDHHATTPCDPRVVDAMAPFLTATFGNPSSRSHAFGREAEDAVETARRTVAEAIGARPEEIVFTSGATEADNLAVFGAARARREAGDGDHVVISAVEHRAVLKPAEALRGEGFEVTVVGVDGEGRVDPERLAEALGARTVLVSVILANNEIGTIEPLAEIAAVAHERGAWVHTDAVQAIGRIPVDVDELDVDLLSLTAHKFYGPKGAGALYVRKAPRRVKLVPQMVGGGQERGLRSGTLNVPGIVGLGKAIEIAEAERETEVERVAALRDRLEEGLKGTIEGLVVNGSSDRRIAPNLNVSIPHVDGEALLLSLHDIAVSSGSACRSTTPTASHVLKAIGRDDDLARSSVRFGLGRWTTEEEIDYAVRRVSETVERLRSMSVLP